RYQFVGGNPVNRVDLYGFCDPRRDPCSPTVPRIPESGCGITKSCKTMTAQQQVDSMAANTKRGLETGLEETKELQVEVENMTNQLASALPGLHTSMVQAQWAAYHAKIDYYDHTVIGGVVGRLAARGYEMDYGVVGEYLGRRISETQTVFSMRQSQYASAQNTYYGAVEAYTMLSDFSVSLVADTRSMGDAISDLDNFYVYLTDLSHKSYQHGVKVLNNALHNTRMSPAMSVETRRFINGSTKSSRHTVEFERFFGHYFESGTDAQSYLFDYFQAGVMHSYMNFDFLQWNIDELERELQSIEAAASKRLLEKQLDPGAIFNQVVYGNYSEDVTLTGTGVQILLGFTGIDVAADLRDVTYDITHWEWSWGHAGQTTVDGIGLIPVIGAVKSGDELGSLIKASSKGLQTAEELKRTDEIAKQLSILKKKKHNYRNIQDIDALDDINNFLSTGKQTAINPFSKQKEFDRIFTVDKNGKVRSVRMGDHETRNPNNFHYHLEDWINLNDWKPGTKLPEPIKPDQFVHINKTSQKKLNNVKD
ncbi:MAG: hypothetical protein ACOCXT_06970, partial [Candidatus Dojkabacteria bacterium]